MPQQLQGSGHQIAFPRSLRPAAAQAGASPETACGAEPADRRAGTIRLAVLPAAFRRPAQLRPCSVPDQSAAFPHVFWTRIPAACSSPAVLAGIPPVCVPNDVPGRSCVARPVWPSYGQYPACRRRRLSLHCGGPSLFLPEACPRSLTDSPPGPVLAVEPPQNRPAARAGRAVPWKPFGRVAGCEGNPQ